MSSPFKVEQVERWNKWTHLRGKIRCSTSEKPSGTQVEQWDCPRKNAKCSTVPAVPPIIEKPASVLSKSPDEEWAEYDARFNASKTILSGRLDTTLP